MGVFDNVIMPGDKTPVNPYTKNFIYGEGGAGKTLLAATAPRPFFIDTENSTEVLDSWPELKKKAGIAHVKKFEDVREILNAFARDDEFIRGKFDTIVLDSISEGQQQNLTGVVSEAAAAALNPETNKSSRDLDIPFQQDYFKSGGQLRRLLVNMRGLPYHIIVIGHTREEVDKNKSIYVRPDLPPGLAGLVRRIFGLVGYMRGATSLDDNGGEVHKNVLYTRQIDGSYVAKCRYRYLATKVEQPTFQHILDSKLLAIQKGLEEEADDDEVEKMVENPPTDLPDDSTDIVWETKQPNEMQTETH